MDKGCMRYSHVIYIASSTNAPDVCRKLLTHAACCSGSSPIGLLSITLLAMQQLLSDGAAS